MEPLLLNFVNLLLSCAWGWAAMCRLAKMHDGVLLRVAVVYVALFVAAVFCGLQFFIFGTNAGYADLIASAAILAVMLSSVPRWRDGPPCDALRCPPVL